ncbi:hypothetical protein [Methylobacterium pseudosasicola]|uniref:Uncharacterized protein n=1 Tax=Methylobacterium pseudosasicola TaxID=582667 RepID=A0A1I4H3Z9_9HYPH|nr:hypothetical protein [Methylobacterium pseudosasicola]SFL37042.1 hypothetical protein SAMN05192568_100424 [Methylobacterium pseudosasicola]
MGSVCEGSLGFGLVRSLLKRLDGEIDVRREAGVTGTISFPELPAAETDG